MATETRVLLLTIATSLATFAVACGGGNDEDGSTTGAGGNSVNTAASTTVGTGSGGEASTGQGGAGGAMGGVATGEVPPRVLLPGEAGATTTATVELNLAVLDPMTSVALTVTGLPVGVTASALTIASGTAAGDITFTASANVELGEYPIAFELTPSAGMAATLRSYLVVHGQSGSHDASFGGDDGIVRVTDVETTPVAAVALDPPRGRIYLGTSVFANPGFDMMVARFSPTGAPDPSFGSASGVLGRRVVQIPIDVETLTQLLVQSDGGLVLAGRDYFENPIRSTILARLLPEGDLDTTFAEGGIHRENVTPADVEEPRFLAAAGDRLLVGGSYLGDASRDWIHPYLIGLDAKGQRDATYGAQGLVLLGGSAFPPNIAGGYSFAIDSQGRVVMAGHIMVNLGMNDMNYFVHDTFVLRATAAGGLDETFGTKGIVTIPKDPQYPEGNTPAAIAIGADDAIFVVTSLIEAQTLPPPGDRVTKLLAQSGAIDTAFGTDGSAKLLAPEYFFTQRMAIDPIDRRMYVGGIVFDSGGGDSTEVALLRVSPQGDADPTFGPGGILTIPFAANENGTLDDLVVSPGGVVYGAGGISDTGVALFRAWP